MEKVLSRNGEINIFHYKEGQSRHVAFLLDKDNPAMNFAMTEGLTRDDAIYMLYQTFKLNLWSECIRYEQRAKTKDIT